MFILFLGEFFRWRGGVGNDGKANDLLDVI
jgi:hypothetical protein